MAGWLSTLGKNFLGSADSMGWGELGLKAGGAYLDYNAKQDARKDKIKMFDKQFGMEKSQINFQNAEYLAKKKAEEDAWNKFENPYANTGNTIV